MTVLRGSDFRQAFDAATRCLEHYRDAINALNVFPVPDGDTGTNMLLTMRSAMERCSDRSDASAADVTAGLADGAFWGARGNSGVILSQFYRGFADALTGEEVCDGPSLAQALKLAADAAYQSVGQPVEGTMLTVIRSTAMAVQEELDRGENPDTLALWGTAFHAAVVALYRTPSQLPVLEEAGVVDAGGMGIVAIIGGILCFLAGRDRDLVDRALAEACVEPVPVTGAGPRIETGHPDTSLNAQWGYCIQFLIESDGEGGGLALEQIRERLGKEVSDSAVVVGDGRHARVHVHAADPGPPLSYGASLGSLHQIRIENMNAQTVEFIAEHRTKVPAPGSISVVAVAQGEGLAHLFRDHGCAAVIDGGQTMNPSVQEILDAAGGSGGEETIILPNNSNVVATAEQSAGANPRVHVVPSRTLPQGVAAMLAFNPEDPLERNLERMGRALETVVTIEVTQAVRTASVEGKVVEAGRYIGLLEGELATSGDSPESALEAALDRIVSSEDQIITLYQGADASPAGADELRRRLEAQTPGIQVDLVYGGQPHYHYLASVE
jgi:DAK2 domain fusion protein YloV